VTRLVHGTCALAFLGALVLFGATPSSAAAASAPAPKGFCPAMTKAADAGQVLVTHPTPVAANRAQLAVLTTSNLLGQNAPAIASTEAAYMEMWAQDVSAMLRDEGSASAEAKLHLKATAVLVRVDADVRRDCPGSAEAFKELIAQEKKAGLRP
jgi:PPE-repeat protein